MTTNLHDVTVPDIGDFEEVDVIEVLVAIGDQVEVEQSLITLESDKATMEIPSPQAGVVRELLVEVGAKVSEGAVIVRLEVDEVRATDGEANETAKEVPPAAGPAGIGAAPPPGLLPGDEHPVAVLPDADVTAEVVVVGAGPGGYTAAFRAADLGKRVVLVERYADLGGVCLNVGCIPSKALLHLADVVNEVRAMEKHGIAFGDPSFDLDRIRGHKQEVVEKLTSGLAGLAKRRKVTVLRGTATFDGPNLVNVESSESPGEVTRVAFENAVIAVGSKPVRLPGVPDDPRIMDSTGALALEDVPGRLLVIGGGIIGLEMASVFHALGSKVTVVELLDVLMTGADPDLVKPLRRIIDKRYENIFLGTKVTRIEATSDGMKVSFEGEGAPVADSFDRVLVSVGRAPNGAAISAEKAGVEVDEHGFIRVDAQQRTNVPHVFAIGDVTGPPMLAHKATHEGKVAAEVIAGLPSAFVAKAIPSVAYTDPEVAWMGLTEADAKEQGVEVRKASFPWAASGRALGIGRDEGATKLLFDAESGRLVGAGIVGPHAGDLIAEATLALEMGAEAEDVALTIHPHPTLSETIAFAAEMAEGTITDLYIRKRR